MMFSPVPQDAHERLLIEQLAALGIHVERRTQLIRFDQHDAGVRAVIPMLRYHGSIIGITAVGKPNATQDWSVGDVAGFYYRLIRWPNATSLWTLSLSLMYPLVLAAVLPFAWRIRRSRRRRRGFPVGQPTPARGRPT